MPFAPGIPLVQLAQTPTLARGFSTTPTGRNLEDLFRGKGDNGRQVMLLPRFIGEWLAKLALSRLLRSIYLYIYIYIWYIYIYIIYPTQKKNRP